MVEPGFFRGKFQDCCDRFVAYLEQLGRSQLTLKNYRSDLKAFGQWLETAEAGALNPTMLGHKEMRQYQEFLLTDQKLQPNSVKRRLARSETSISGYSKQEWLPLLHSQAFLFKSNNTRGKGRSP
jgi:site-specific recombinase XerC